MGRRKGGHDWPRALVVYICRDFWRNLSESQRALFARTGKLELHRGAGGDPALTRTLCNIRVAVLCDDHTTALARGLTRAQVYDIVKAHLAQYFTQGDDLHRVRKSSVPASSSSTAPRPPPQQLQQETTQLQAGPCGVAAAVPVESPSSLAPLAAPLASGGVRAAAPSQMRNTWPGDPPRPGTAAHAAAGLQQQQQQQRGTWPVAAAAAHTTAELRMMEQLQQQQLQQRRRRRRSASPGGTSAARAATGPRSLPPQQQRSPWPVAAPVPAAQAIAESTSRLLPPLRQPQPQQQPQRSPFPVASPAAQAVAESTSRLLPPLPQPQPQPQQQQQQQQRRMWPVDTTAANFATGLNPPQQQRSRPMEMPPFAAHATSGSRPPQQQQQQQQQQQRRRSAAGGCAEGMRPRIYM